MAITDLFRQTVTLLRTTAETRDLIGGAVPGTVESTTVRGYLEPLSTTRQGGQGEDLSDRGTLIGDWLLAVPSDTDLTGWDRVTYEGHTFDVLGPPRPFFNPRSESDHHIEVYLREVR